MNLSSSKIFLIFCLSFITGVFLGRFVNFPIMAVGAMVFIITAALGWQNRLVLVVGIAGLVAVAGMWRFEAEFRQNDLNQYYDREVVVTARVSEEADQRIDKTLLTMDRVAVGEQRHDSKILVIAPMYPEYAYGDALQITGKIQEPPDASAAGEFSYKNYLSRYGIDAIMYYPEMEKTGEEGGWLKSAILDFKSHWMDNLNRILPEPANALLSGLLLGSRRAIPEDLSDAFAITGVSHIVAVSGFNITIIAAGIDWLLRRFFQKRISLLLSLVAIALFVIMSGASASVVRAGIMGSLLLLAYNLGRMYAIANALALTAAVMMAINPQILHFDVGFQLSFAALLGLVYLAPLMEKYFWRLPKLLRQYLVATLAASVATLPILLFNFGRLSLIAPLANILILPFIPATMLLGFLSGILSFAATALSLPFAWMAWVLLEYIINTATFLAGLPLAALSVRIGALGMVIYYFLIMMSLIKHKLWNAEPDSY